MRRPTKTSLRRKLDKICSVCGRSEKEVKFYDGHFTCGECECNVQKNKRKEKRVIWDKEKICPVCLKQFNPYIPQQVYCSIECNVKKYQVWKRENPVKYRAFTLSNTLVGLKNKKVVLEEKLNRAIGKKCPYCERIIDVNNASLDHMKPLQRNKGLEKKKIIELNQPNNLQIICRKCNLLKSDLSDTQFIALFEFLSKDLDMKEKVLKRLSRSNHIWKK